jgi:murein DD-endopeptidase MepM/ murein hydrolase activator NlpD
MGATATQCPEGSLPDGDVCVALPLEGSEGPELPDVTNTHRDRRGQWVRYDQIPRLPERPADYDLYRYPVAPGMPGGHAVISGYDLDQPNERQRRGQTLSHVGHGGVDLPQRKGAPIVMVPLEHQEGDAEVLFVGDLFGRTVVTLHTVREGGQVREYVMLFGHLDAAAAGLSKGAHLASGDLVGTVGDTGSPELVHLHLEARRVRTTVNIRSEPGYKLVANECTVVCDPRNVLPLK